ncbi:MAG: hypothetical protein QF890_12690 [Myxococcota bacterium]|jgi:hypothetical protein|nr:hypothetical protein [Deltaproteobacteria bacterium]MCP4240545.1 hypothetical protein [bacterium]MDP7076624.1 hypothetical protein [Myxococcota bacterium]MDP7298821.1 hypothetical protein [Myxococcota bacterium]MDP7433415.1 hypothetical protein [Myxococcota bacterium]
MPDRRLLPGLAGLETDAGTANVARCVTEALDEDCGERRTGRADRVLLLDDAGQPPATPVRGEQ